MHSTSSRLFSLGLSLILNSFFILLLFMGFTFSVRKKEVVVISLLEPSLEIPRTEVETKVAPIEYGSKEEKRDISKKEPVGPSRGAREDRIIKERVSALKERQQKAISKEREEGADYLRERLSTLRESAGNRGRAQQTVHSGGKTGEPSAKEAQSEQRLSSEYLFLVKRKLQTHFEIPIYLRNRPGLSALVEIEVRENGEIAKISFIRASSDPAFNRAVENCLRAVNPLPVDRATKLRIEFRSEGIGSIS